MSVDDLTVGFAGAEPVVSDVSFALSSGDSLLICGSGGAGKSTILAAAGGIIPRLIKPALLAGLVRLAGEPLPQWDGPRLFATIGFVFQNLDDQLWNISVEDVIAFPLENRQIARAEIRVRIGRAVRQFGLEHLCGRQVLTLSGGERRLVALAAAMAGQPDLLILDEPTTGLDPAARRRLTLSLRDLGREARAPALLTADQDASSLAAAVRQVAFLADGRLSSAQPLSNLEASPLWRQAGVIAPGERLVRHGGAERGPEVLAVAGLRSARRHRSDAPVLRDVSFAVLAGEVVALIGPNGAGKTTLFQTLLGLLGQAAGSLAIAGQDARGWTAAQRARQIGYLPQNMRRILFNMSVLEEAAFSVAGEPRRMADPLVRQAAMEALERYGLQRKAELSPFALSAREQGLLGLACIDSGRCRVAILDEPLLARDRSGRRLLGLFLAAARADGRAVILISHDLELVDDVADRVLILQDGVIAFSGAPAEAWRSTRFAALDWARPYAPLVSDAA